jgi:glycosyltransferase involved in cell wall biosynthesis
MRHAARHARAVVCPTESARRDAIEVLGLAPAKTHVVSPPVAAMFNRAPDENVVVETLQRLGVHPGFVLFVGTIEPRKNLVTLARAFARLRAAGFGGQLVICGGWGWKSHDLRPAIDDLGISDEVVFTGYIPDADVVALLNAASVFVYPSLYEGFGVPIVEAFAAGLPVVTSDRGATAEAAGGAALLADPESPIAIADAIATVLSDPDERQRLRVAGLARAAVFSRANAARQAVRVYESVLGR